MVQPRMKNIMLLVGLMMMPILWAGATAQSSTPSCMNVLLSLSPCLNYITGNSSAPSSSCCAQLANVVQSTPRCLCEVFNGGGSSLGLTINQTQAMTLPGATKLQERDRATNSSNFPQTSRAAALSWCRLFLLIEIIFTFHCFTTFADSILSSSKRI